MTYKGEKNCELSLKIFFLIHIMKGEDVKARSPFSVHTRENIKVRDVQNCVQLRSKYSETLRFKEVKS